MFVIRNIDKMKKLSFKLLILLSLLAILGFGRKKSSFMLVLLPDTQNYTALYPEILNSQTKWISENSEKIAFVLQQGDLTDHNSTEQWENAKTAFGILENKVLLTVVPGNHDMGTNGNADTRNTDLFNQYFPVKRFSKQSSFGGVFEEGKSDNIWHKFQSGGYNWLIISLEFGPRDIVLNWASGVIKNHPKHKVIINTHAYMYSDETRIGSDKKHKWNPHNYGFARNSRPGEVNDGEQMWEKLVKKHKNILLVFSGHILNDGVGTLVSEGDNGNKVYQMLANFQSGVEGSENGGNGFLRLININPAKNEIAVRTYSPYLNKYKTDLTHEFTFRNVGF